jgi:putative ABC transport system permease protein
MTFKNITLAFRHIFTYKAYSFLNIIGLAIGMACAMLIILWVDSELTVNKFHKNAKNIYMLRVHATFTGGQGSVWVSNTSPLGPVVANEVPEVKYSVRITWTNDQLFRSGEKKFFEKGFYADSVFFRVFSFKLLQGDSTTVLNTANSIAISEKLAKKYFGNENPMGKTILVRDRDNIREELFTVTGVFKDVTKQSSMEFDYVLPFSKYYQYNKNWLRWGNYNLMLFVQTKTNTNSGVLDKKFTDLLHKYDSWAKKNAKIITQPLDAVYLYDDYTDSPKHPSGRIVFVKIFSIVALIIIFLACMNYTNLATALAIKRAKEVGIKKVFGSNRGKLIFNFTLEAILLTFMGFFLSLIIIECSLHWFNDLIGKQIELNYANVRNFAWFLIVPLFTGLFAGTFPALFLSSFNPVVVLKKLISPKKGTLHLRHVLVIFQFTVTIVFIIASFVIVKQVRYIQHKALGLDKDNVIMFDQSMGIIKHRQLFKQELKKQPGIINVSYTGSDPLSVNSSTTDPSWRGKTADQVISFPNMTVDDDFASTLGVEILQGRDFSPDYPSDTNCIFINQEALKIMKLENPIGEIVNYWGRKATIVGIVKDFHINSLRVPIQQLIMINRPSDTWLVMVKVRGNMMKEAIKNIEKTFNDFENNVPFNYRFLDQEYEKRYDQEKYMSRFSNLFTILAIVISCLGLFGLALFTAEQRTKEIGIRKSIGATTVEVVLLLARDFLKWIAISYVLACILSYFILHSWLQNFAYRTTMGIWIFLLTGVMAVVLALITVSWQSFRAASKNPVESLRYE